jgi:hypothetical protein
MIPLARFAVSKGIKDRNDELCGIEDAPRRIAPFEELASWLFGSSAPLTRLRQMAEPHRISVTKGQVAAALTPLRRVPAAS